MNRQMGMIGQFIRYQFIYFLMLKQSINKMSLTNCLLDRKYSIYKEIGVGRNSIVYVGVNQEDKKEYAIKLYNLGLLESVQKIAAMKKKITMEYGLLKKLQSHNFVKCYDFYESKKFVAVVYQLLPHLTLADQIKKKKLPGQDCKDILKQIIIALDQLHNHRICLKKLVPEDIYIKNGVYKINHLRFFERQSQEQLRLLAPELQEKRELRSLQEIQKVDIWALAMLYLNMRLQNKEQFFQIEKYFDKSMVPSETFYTKEYENYVSFTINDPEENIFLARSLAIIPQKRIDWRSMAKHKMLNSTNIYMSRNYITDFTYEKFLENSKEGRMPSVILEQEDLETALLGVQKKSFSFKKLNPSDIEIYNEDIDREEQKVYKILQKYYFEALKCEFLLSQILIPLQKMGWKKRQQIQFLYLVSSRCFVNLSNINSSLDKLNKIEAKEKFEKKIKRVYEKSLEMFENYSNLLTKEEDKFFNVASDWFKKKGQMQDYKKREKYFGGFEGVDFSTSEQIEFTCEHMKKHKIIESLSKVKAAKNIFKYLQIYKQINGLQHSEENEGKKIKQCVEEILSQENVIK